MSEPEVVVVHVEQDEATARIVAGFLEANGIPAKILEDDAGDQIPSLEAVHGVQIIAPAEYAEKAKELLASRDGAPLDEGDD